jgi:hypothetical protein
MADRQDIARMLLSDPMCVQCLCSKSGFTLDRVLDALAALETTVRISRAWGDCGFCGQRRGILSIA